MRDYLNSIIQQHQLGVTNSADILKTLLHQYTHSYRFFKPAHSNFATNLTTLLNHTNLNIFPQTEKSMHRVIHELNEYKEKISNKDNFNKLLTAFFSIYYTYGKLLKNSRLNLNLSDYHHHLINQKITPLLDKLKNESIAEKQESLILYLKSFSYFLSENQKYIYAEKIISHPNCKYIVKKNDAIRRMIRKLSFPEKRKIIRNLLKKINISDDADEKILIYSTLITLKNIIPEDLNIKIIDHSIKYLENEITSSELKNCSLEALRKLSHSVSLKQKTCVINTLLIALNDRELQQQAYLSLCCLNYNTVTEFTISNIINKILSVVTASSYKHGLLDIKYLAQLPDTIPHYKWSLWINSLINDLMLHVKNGQKIDVNNICRTLGFLAHKMSLEQRLETANIFIKMNKSEYISLYLVEEPLIQLYIVSDEEVQNIILAFIKKELLCNNKNRILIPLFEHRNKIDDIRKMRLIPIIFETICTWKSTCYQEKIQGLLYSLFNNLSMDQKTFIIEYILNESSKQDSHYQSAICNFLSIYKDILPQQVKKIIINMSIHHNLKIFVLVFIDFSEFVPLNIAHKVVTAHLEYIDKSLFLLSKMCLLKQWVTPEQRLTIIRYMLKHRFDVPLWNFDHVLQFLPKEYFPLIIQMILPDIINKDPRSIHQRHYYVLDKLKNSLKDPEVKSIDSQISLLFKKISQPGNEIHAIHSLINSRSLLNKKHRITLYEYLLDKLQANFIYWDECIKWIWELKSSVPKKYKFRTIDIYLSLHDEKKDNNSHKKINEQLHSWIADLSYEERISLMNRSVHNHTENSLHLCQNTIYRANKIQDELRENTDMPEALTHVVGEYAAGGESHYRYP